MLDPQGRRIFELRAGSQFIIVVEAVRGASGSDVGKSLIPFGMSNRPDLQIQAARPLGNGSLAVCDIGMPPQGGGIPAINPPSFAPASEMISNALNDFACRFEAHSRNEPCTINGPERLPALIVATTDTQFCDAVSQTEVFPPGDTLVTAAVRDLSGQLGPTAQMIVRIASPTPTPP